VVRGQQAGLARVWRQLAVQLDAAAAANNYGAMLLALDGLSAVMRRWDVVAVVQVGGVWRGCARVRACMPACVRLCVRLCA
jgi:hypothetical protein